jgi:hypothetical protein
VRLWGGRGLFAIPAVLISLSSAFAAEFPLIVEGATPSVAPFSVFVRKVLQVYEPRPLYLRRTDGSNTLQFLTGTEIGARLRLTEQSTAYVKILKFRTSVPPAARGVEPPSHNLFARPRAKAMTAGLRFSF